MAASEWSASKENPITEAEWLAYVEKDKEMKLEPVATACNPKTGEVIRVASPLMAVWTDPAAQAKHYFSYFRGEVSVKNPSEAVINKMKFMATALGARVQGDEGEWY